MVNILAYDQTVPAPRAGSIMPIPIPTAASPQTVASLSITILPGAPSNNRVELNATLGVAGTGSVSQVVVNILRDGSLIFSTEQGIQTATEQFYSIHFTTADFDVPVGDHQYTLTIERTTGGATASVAGPITFSALALGPVA